MVVRQVEGSKQQAVSDVNPLQRKDVGRSYGDPQVASKPSFSDEVGLRGVVRGGPVRETPEIMRRYAEAVIKKRGVELSQKLPPKYNRQLNKTLKTMSNAGFGRKEVTATRYVVAEALLRRGFA